MLKFFLKDDKGLRGEATLRHEYRLCTMKDIIDQNELEDEKKDIIDQIEAEDEDDDRDEYF